MVAWEMGMGEGRTGEMKCKGQEETFGVMVIFITLIMVIAPWVYTCVKTYQIAYFKYVQFVTLYINKVVKNKHKRNGEQLKLILSI